MFSNLRLGFKIVVTFGIFNRVQFTLTTRSVDTFGIQDTNTPLNIVRFYF